MRTKYKIDGASFVTAQDILQELRDTTKIQADKENSNASIGISLVDIGHAVKHIFPFVTHKKGWVNGKSVWVYDGLARLTKDRNITVCTLTNSEVEVIAAKYGWVRTYENATKSFTDFVLIESQETVNGQRIAKRRFFSGDTVKYELYIPNRATPIDVLKGSMKFEKTMKNIFKFLAQIKICRGFSVTSTSDSLNGQREVTGKVEHWATREDLSTETLRHRSIQCKMVLNGDSREIACTACSKIKRNTSNLNVDTRRDNASASKTRENPMTI